MRERPILFSSAMVRAILDGQKTQTRRVVKLPPAPMHLGEWEPGTISADPAANSTVAIPHQACLWHTRTGKSLLCPIGQPGDRLWVRETWYCDDYRVQSGPYLKPDDFNVEEERESGGLVYAADGRSPYEAEQPVWRPSIHMPRWACRLVLEIADVRVERLQDISDADAASVGCAGGHGSIPGYGYSATPSEHFAHLWRDLYGDDSWAANPWVWVIGFKRVPA